VRGAWDRINQITCKVNAAVGVLEVPSSSPNAERKSPASAVTCRQHWGPRNFRGPRLPSERVLLRHGADRVEPQEQAQ